MGNRITADGLKPDENKVKATTHMLLPEGRKGLQRLLGMTKHLAQCIPHESVITAPLRQLPKPETAWSWQPEHMKALDGIKDSLSCMPVLRYYDVEKPVTIQADASKGELGVYLLQEGQPIHYASRTMNDTESPFSLLEKETLAICYAAKEFHQYIYDKQVTVRSDPRPSEAFFQKPLAAAASPRVQRMLLKLQPYVLNVVYIPGKLMYVAGILSRAQLQRDIQVEDMAEGLEVMVHLLVRDIPVSPDRKAEIRIATAEDPQMQQLYQAVTSVWPERRCRAPDILQHYWQFKTQIYCAEMLTLLHKSHMGAERQRPGLHSIGQACLKP